MLQNFTKSRIKPVYVRKSTTTCQKFALLFVEDYFVGQNQKCSEISHKIDLSHIFANENVYLKLKFSKNDRVDENVFNFFRIFATQCFIE